MSKVPKAGVIASVVSLLIILVGTGAMAAGQSGVQRELAQVNRATAQYHDIQTATDAGYVLASPCVPGMGYHYELDIAEKAQDLDTRVPNILVYAPRGDGGLRLVAVEYATWADDAQLFGVDFDAAGEDGPRFATLHAWIWQANPHGTFAPHNPNVHC